MTQVWVCSNRPTENEPEGSDVWHLGRERTSIGPVSGTVLARWYVAASRGRKLGGAWGQTESNVPPTPHHRMCARCAKLAV